MNKRIRQYSIIVYLLLFFVVVFPSILSFLYPMELEIRESTVWLHVLALKAGINIYDHNQVAFINMNHGPMDPIVKTAIYSILPFLESWQLIRIFVLLLPWILLAINYWLLRNQTADPLKKSILISALAYGFLFVVMKPILGRSDPTAATWIILLSGLVLMYQGKKSFLNGFLTGICGAAVFFTNWRLIPIITVISTWPLCNYTLAKKISKKELIQYFLAFIGGGLFIFLLIIHFCFNWDIVKYYKHFFGFFTFASGWGIISPGFHIRYIIRNLIGTYTTLARSHATLLSVFMVLILISIEVLKICRRKTKFQLSYPLWRLGSLLVIFCSDLFGLFMNFLGGGSNYLMSTCILLWFLYLDSYIRFQDAGFSLRWSFLQKALSNSSKLKNDESFRSILTGLIFLCIMIGSCQFVSLPLLFMKYQQKSAFFMNTLRELNIENQVVSESLHLYKNRYHSELIDMGDSCYKVSKTGYYGTDFTDTVNRYYQNLNSLPPKYILFAYTDGPIIKELISAKYKKLFVGPTFPQSNVFGVTLFVRID